MRILYVPDHLIISAGIVPITNTLEVTYLKRLLEQLIAHITENPPNFGESDSVLTLLYEAYSEIHNLDDIQTKADFHALYAAMNGMPLQEMDRIVDPLCSLCRDHERSGFINGVKIGICLRAELEGK